VGVTLRRDIERDAPGINMQARGYTYKDDVDKDGLRQLQEICLCRIVQKRSGLAMKKFVLYKSIISIFFRSYPKKVQKCMLIFPFAKH
jgi:hypothetical protein